MKTGPQINEPRKGMIKLLYKESRFRQKWTQHILLAHILASHQVAQISKAVQPINLLKIQLR